MPTTDELRVPTDVRRTNVRSNQGNNNDLSAPQAARDAGRISVNGFNCGIPTHRGAMEYIFETYGEDSMSATMLRFLHSPNIQMTTLFLLFLDAAILVTEIFLLASFPAMCSDKQVLPQAVEIMEGVLFQVTIAILSIFFVQVHLEMVALRPNIYFRQVFYALDYFIVTGSIGLELFFAWRMATSSQKRPRHWRVVCWHWVGFGALYGLVMELWKFPPIGPMMNMLNFWNMPRNWKPQQGTPLPACAKSKKRVRFQGVIDCNATGDALNEIT